MKFIIKSILLALLLTHSVSAYTTETKIFYLSGKDHANPVEWDFFCTKGRKSGKWSKIDVPSHWEMKGYGTFNYGKHGNKSDEVGKYKYNFHASNDWKNSTVRIVFDGVMTDAAVKINGESAGEIHQGSFYRFRYDITKLLKFGRENLLEVKVKKKSDDKTLDVAERNSDYWVFGGIYRPVFLEVLPSSFIDRTAINADDKGNFSIDLFTENAKSTDLLSVQLKAMDGKTVTKTITGSANKELRIETKIQNPDLWTAETPNLYFAEVSLKRNGKTIHSLTERFGFRKLIIDSEQGLILNGTPIRIRGINRHCHMPESGRSVTYEETLADLKLIKSMNFNAIRCSHYPPDKYMLDLCDEMGFYVIDELCTWQEPHIQTELARKLVKEMVIRDVNHPSIIFWANGNEGGWNEEVDDDYHIYDPQKRQVIHPWSQFRGLDTKHYIQYGIARQKGDGEMPFMPTEFLHGLFDGGLGAGLDDFWSLFRTKRKFVGGFLWVFSDQGLVRSDKDHIIDVDGNHAPDGIVGPYLEKEGSYYAIREIYCPVQPTRTDKGYSFENRHHFRDLKDLVYTINDGEWNYFPPTPPGDSCEIYIKSSHNKTERLKILDWNGDVIYDKTIALAEKEQIREDIISPTATDAVVPPIKQSEKGIEVGPFLFDKDNLRLLSSPGNTLKNGPRLVASSDKAFASNNDKKQKFKKDNANATLEIQNAFGFDLLRWTILSSNTVKLEYKYTLTGEYEYFGVTFDLPQDRIKRYKYTGYGPSNVWKNRLRGGSFGAWSKKWSDQIWGQTWDFPISEGYFGEFFGIEMDAGKVPFKIATDSNDLFLRLGTHDYITRKRGKCLPPFPEGDLSILHGIPAIGTKFHKAELMGPSGRLNKAKGQYSAVLFLQFDRNQ